MAQQRPLQDSHEKLRSQGNYFLKAHDDTLRRNSLWAIKFDNRSIVHHELFISLKELSQMPLYGQPKSSCE